jgi:hypothetical protein
MKNAIKVNARHLKLSSCVSKNNKPAKRGIKNSTEKIKIVHFM